MNEVLRTTEDHLDNGWPWVDQLQTWPYLPGPYRDTFGC